MAAIDRATNHKINLMVPPACVDLLGLGGRDLQPPVFLKDLGDQITGKVFKAAAEAVREPAHLLCEIRQGKLRPLLSVGKLSLRLRKLFNAKLGPLLRRSKLRKMPVRPLLSVSKLHKMPIRPLLSVSKLRKMPIRPLLSVGKLHKMRFRPLLSVGKLSLRLRKLFNAKLGPLLRRSKLRKMPVRPLLSVGKLHKMPIRPLLSVGKLSLRLQKIGRDVAQIGNEVAQIGNDASQFVKVSLGHEILVGLDHHMGEHIRLLLGKDLEESSTNLGDRGHRSILFIT
jgi:hypothetical protein